MRKKIFLGLLTLFLFFLPSHLAAKKYDLDDFRIRAEVQPDGRLKLFEAITYDFDGRFRYAFRTIPLKPGESISEIRVVDEGHSLIESSSEKPGTTRWSDTAMVSRFDGISRPATRSEPFGWTTR